MQSAQGHDIPCFPSAEGRALAPAQDLRGFGITDAGLVKISVNVAGQWIVTFSPATAPNDLCVIFLGTDWTSATAESRGAAWRAE